MLYRMLVKERNLKYVTFSKSIIINIAFFILDVKNFFLFILQPMSL